MIERILEHLDLAGVVVNLIALAVILIIAALALFIIKRGFAKYQIHADNDIPSEKKTYMRIIYSVIKFSILALAILGGLSAMGFNITGAIAGLGIAGAIGALAVQDALKDFIQGVNIATDKFFSIGDVIEYNGYRGKVIELSMRNTKLKSIDDDSVRTIGNHLLVDVTKMAGTLNLNIPLSYDADMDQCYQVLGQIADEANSLPHIKSAVFKGTQNFGDSAIEYRIAVEPVSVEDMFNAKRELLGLAQKRLHEAGLEIPYSQLDVHMK